MTKTLDLLDIQGNIVRPYGRFGFPLARYLLLNVQGSRRGRVWLGRMIPHVTTAATWGDGPGLLPKPMATLNIAINRAGFVALELPRESMISFPAEFSMGMSARKDILGDDGPSSPAGWDPVWRGTTAEKAVHILVTLNARDAGAMSAQYDWVLEQLALSGGAVALLDGHRSADGNHLPYQEGHLLLERGEPTSKEHFGYTDGIGDPYFEGIQNPASQVEGRGKQMPDGSWQPLALGEFLLGHLDEARQYPPAPQPLLLSRNGTYMVYRKLHQNVASFDELLQREGAHYPGGPELLAAKFVGRWRNNGAPLVNAPDALTKQVWDARFSKASPVEQDAMLSDFVYDDDMSGARCPLSAHIRRLNPRASLELKAGKSPGEFVRNLNAFDTPGALANRRRILRRGLPYGDNSTVRSDAGEQGVIMMMLNADIGRQYEFIQQQWVNCGNDFREGNDKEVLLGNHNVQNPTRVIHGVDPRGDAPPRFVNNIPRLVETRGGDYFFVPSLTAMRLIARGLIDPT